MTGRKSWNLGAMLAGELTRDGYSHCSAALAEWAYVPDPADVLFLNWLDVTAQMNHRPGKVAPRPAVRPWAQKSAAKIRPTSAESDARRARLRERLGLT